MTGNSQCAGTRDNGKIRCVLPKGHTTMHRGRDGLRWGTGKKKPRRT